MADVVLDARIWASVPWFAPWFEHHGLNLKKSIPVLHFLPYLLIRVRMIVFIRVFVVSITVVALWWSSSSFGLGFGLGELSLKSHLASPLKASVTLRGMDGIDLDPEYLSIRIDSDSKAKIEYRLQRMDADTAVIDLYTREAISEPLFQFRIEVKWDSSAVARSYDVLIDPPAYQEYFRTVENGKTGIDKTLDYEQTSEQNDHAMQQPVALSDEVSSDPGLAVTTVAATPAGESAGSRGSSDAVRPRSEYGPTINGNSIWRVARAVATDNRELTLYQWMYAIWDANSQAFARDNMHRLNMDEVLGIPFEDEVAATTHSMAWRAYSSQMSMLQTRIPASDTAKLDVPAEAQQPVTNEVIVQQTDPNIATEVALADEKAIAAAQGFEVLAADGSLIALLEESAATIDRESVVAQNNASVEAASQEAVLVASGIEVETQQAVGIDDRLDTPMVADSAVDEPGTLEEQSSEAPVILDSFDSETAGNRLSTNTVEDEITIDSISPGTIDSVAGGWSVALLARQEYVAQLPVIGAEGTLAFVGRAVQSIDRFVATSPSWAALGFGAWVTLVLLMLRQELLARRAAARAAKLPAAKLAVAAVAKPAARKKPVASSADLEKPISTSTERLKSLSKARRKSVSEERHESVSEERHESVSEERHESVSEERHESAAEVQPESSPPARPVTSNASEIIAQANLILSQGDIEEAIKLMRLAVELQPHQPTLVMLLLELYHKTERAVFFAELLDRSRSVLDSLEATDLFRLRAMHAQSCPDLAFVFGQDESTDFSEQLAGDSSEWSSEADPVSDLEGLPLLEAADDNDELIAGVELDSPNEIGPDDKLGLDEVATASDDDFEYPRINDDLDDEAFVETQVIFTNNGISLREDSTPMPGLVGENIELDVTLKEADVYLAYGLYDNAEELLLKGMEVDPERTDFLARLLDAYFATRNIVDFVTCAEVMQDMGEAGTEYWDKVEVMGFELAPNNKLFAGGKDRGLSTDELEIVKPETADFDFSDIAENKQAAVHDIEIEGSSEVAFADLEIFGIEDDDSASAGLNLDLDANDLSDSNDAGLDDLESELEQVQGSEEPDIADSKDELAIVIDVTVDDLDVALSECLTATEDELAAVSAVGINDDEEINLEFGEDEVMEFTMDDDVESEPNTTTDADDADLKMVEDKTIDSLTSVNLDSRNSRILYFPDSSSEGENTDEFESEVKMTLQAIRDQLQNMTERLFHQERATNDLQQTLADLKEASSAAKGKKSKKSS